MYIAAFGLFTDVSYQTKQNVKNVLGHLAYVLEGVKRLYNIPSYHVKVTYDDQVIEENFVYGMVTNSRSVGGFRNIIGKHVVFDDGEFEVTLIKSPKNALELQEIIAALLIEQIDTKHMYTFKTNHITFESLEEISVDTGWGNLAVSMILYRFTTKNRRFRLWYRLSIFHL